MKKMTKLLSVILAFVMALSCMTMMASAAKTSYQTVANLEALDAYSPYGTVTRLTTEERLSILCDTLDNLLAKLNINMGTINVVLAKVTLDFTSLNQVLVSLDSFYSAKGLLGIVGGTIKKLKLDSWQTKMSREGTAHQVIINEILELLSTNTDAIGSIFDDGLSLGLIGSFIKGLNLGPINNAVKDLPGLIKAIVLPLMGRQDDNAAQRDVLSKKDSDLITVAQDFANGLFTKKMGWTSYRVDGSGKDLGYTDALPTEATGTSRYFEKNADGTITQFDYAYAGALGGTAGYKETVTYTLSDKEEYEGSGTYLYKAPEGYDGDETLKWYKAENKADANGNIQSGYWLPTVKAAMDSGELSFNINGADSLLSIVYKFAPYIFAEMAPTVLNGSAKKLIAEAFDVDFTKIGVKGGAEVAAEAAATGNPGNFFTKAQEYYTWEYSDYKVINGTPYYRFQDTYFKGEIPKNISVYYSMFNWDWNISGDFMNEFIPTTVGETWALDGLNNLVKKAINTMLVDSWTVKGVTYNRDEVFNWQAGGNDKLLDNLMVCARNFFNIAPEEIVDEYFAEAQFYNAMMNGTMSQAVNGLVCELVKLIMPQIVFADNIVDQPITAIAAIVVRELCTQLMPTYNFDAMIYANYGKAGAPDRALLSHTADEWLDITLYMGVNLGMYYLRNIADIGEDKDLGYYSVMANLGALPSANGNAMTFTANSYKANGTASWLVAVDWIVDWALDVNTEWCWHFERLVNVDGTVDLATYQDPFKKINSVLVTFIPELTNLLNLEGLDGADYGSGTLIEKVLKDGLVDNIVNLNLTGLLKMFQVPQKSALRQNNIADTLIKLVVTFLNKVTAKVCGGANLINASTINSVATLLNHANIKTVVVNLVGKLYAASNTYKLLDPVLPIVNFFLGWTTDAQKYAEPSSNIVTSGNDAFLLNTATNSVSVTNDSSGMLLKHRNSTTVDKAYTITVTGIDFGDSGITTTATFPRSIAPGEKYDIPMAVPAKNEVAKIIVSYTMTGKDGKQIGGNMTKIAYTYMTTTDDQENVAGRASGDDDDNYNGISEYNRYVFTKDIYTSITDYTASTYGVSSTGGSITQMQFGQFKNTTAPTGLANTYFAQLVTSEAGANGWATSAIDEQAISGKVYKAKAGTTRDTFSEENSKANNLYGMYDMGVIDIISKARNKIALIGTQSWKTSGDLRLEVDFIYYNDYNIDDVVSKYVGYQLKANSFSNASAFTTYENALKEVVRLSQYPKLIDYTTTIQPQIPAAIEALEAAYKNLMNYASSSSSSSNDISKLENKLAEIETNPDRDLNFQDYALFEYFQYEKQRTNARNMIKSVTAPAAPENYIENGVWGNDLITAIVNAQANANVKAGINATVVLTTDPDREDEMNNYSKALAEFKPANYTLLQIEDQEAKLEYYSEFMKANTKIIDKTFLNQEIAYAEAQGYVASAYSADSWARYTDALAKAKAAAASSNKESEIFDAKYELMVAQNKLQLKERSMKEVGYMNEELIPLIQAANAIIDNYGSLYTVKSGVAYNDAFAQLVRALGVSYDVTIDGKEYEGILYDRSALTFQEYDRTATAKNKRAVDYAADKLREAIENFECTAKLEAATGTQVEVEQAIRYIKNVHPNSVPTEAALLAKVNITGATGAAPVVTASKSGNYGTGARIDVVKNDILLASYFVVIDGDVNGDGAVDAFDALEVDVANHTAYYMGDVYDDAADLNSDGIVNASDYSSLAALVMCTNA